MTAWQQTDVRTRVAGNLSATRVDVGDRVRAGDVLATVDVPEVDAAVAQAEATVASKRATLDVAKGPAIDARQMADSADAQQHLQKVTTDRRAELAKTGAVTPQGLDDANAKLSAAGGQPLQRPGGVAEIVVPAGVPSGRR